MKKEMYLGLALLLLALLAFTPAVEIAQSAGGTDQTTKSWQYPSSNTNQQTVQSVQGTAPRQDQSSNVNQQVDRSIEATVTGVDQPEGFLRIRQGPSSSSQIIGCVKVHEKLRLRGNYSSDGRWAELTDKGGWVYAAQIDAPNKPKVQTRARSSSVSYSRTDSDSWDSDPSLWREDAVNVRSYGYGPGIGVVLGWGGRGVVRRGVVRRGGGHHRR